MQALRPALLSVPDAIRTHDLSLRRRTLYPAELRKHIISGQNGRRFFTALLLYSNVAGSASLNKRILIIRHFFRASEYDQADYYKYHHIYGKYYPYTDRRIIKEAFRNYIYQHVL